MKRSRFSEQQIAFILHQAEEGVAVEDVCRKAGISLQTYYRWRKKYGGLMPSEMKRLKLLEEENSRLKKLVADLSLDKAMLQDVVKRKLMWTAPGWQCLCAIENSSSVFPHVSPMFWQEDKDVMPVCIRSTTGMRGGSSAHDLCSDLVTLF